MENIKKGVIIECTECGDVVAISKTNENIEAIKDLKVCEFCLDNYYFKCTECGEYHHEDKRIEVEFLTCWKEVCSDCVEYHDDKYFYCEECGNYKSLEDYEQVEIYDIDNKEYIYMCDSCKSSDPYIIYCEYHERLERTDDDMHVNGYGQMCFRAYEEGEFAYCEDCEDYYHIDDLQYGEDDYLYCNNCIEEHKGHIKSYHEHKMEYLNNNKITNEEEPYNLTFGIELEVESGNYTSCSEMSNILFDNMDGFTVFENDGSLSDGFEIITVPFDNNFYESEGKELLINMLDLLIENKFKSHDTSTCGLHVHIGRHGLGNSYGERDNTIMQIGFIVEYFKEELTTLSRRKAEKLNRWAKFTTKDYKKEELTLDIINKLNRENRSRYSALNLQNEATIELRLFRGTLKKETFLATLELVHNICKYAKENNINDLEALDFYTIATYEKNEYIGDYLELKGIKNKEVC